MKYNLLYYRDTKNNISMQSFIDYIDTLLI